MKTINNKIIFSLAAVLVMGGFSTLLARDNKPSVPKNSKEWYMSTRVSVYDRASNTTHNGTNPAVFGKLSVSRDGYDVNDVLAFGSAANLKAEVVFVQSSWGERTGEYVSDYHDTNGGKKDSWTMTVFSSVPNAEVTLTWDGLYELQSKKGQSGWDEAKNLQSDNLENLVLVDTETGKKIDAVTNGELGTYSFTMGAGGSRTLAWQEESASNARPPKSLETYIKVKQKEEKQKAENAAKESEKIKKDHPFGLPPM